MHYVTRTLLTACREGFTTHSESLQDDKPSGCAPFLVRHEFEDNLVR